MKQQDKALKRKGPESFTSGIPNKKSPSDSMVNKAYSLGYQQAALVNGMKQFQQQQMQAQQEMAVAAQQLMQLQAQVAQEKAKAEAISAAAPPIPAAPVGMPMGGAMPPAAPPAGIIGPDALQGAMAGGLPPAPGGLPPAAPAPVGAPVLPPPQPMM